MEPLAQSTPERLSEIAASYLVFGTSLKMRALHHVLETLEMTVLKTDASCDGLSELRLAFDGCDAKACADKAERIRRLGPQAPKLRQFPIGKVPEIAPLFAEHPQLPKHQGTIFDPDVEVFANCWRQLHTFARFIELADPRKTEEALPEIPFHAAEILRRLSPYTSGNDEREMLSQFIELVQAMDALIERWIACKQLGKSDHLKASIKCWSQRIDPDSSGLLAQFHWLIRGLGNAGVNFEIAVPILGSMSASTLNDWKNLIDQIHHV